jgi:hypothetical protein
MTLVPNFSGSIEIYKSFKLTLTINFPTNFNNYAKFVVSPAVSGEKRIKICSIEVVSSGTNLPCLDCIKKGSKFTYTDTSAASPPLSTTIYDQLKWEIDQIKNMNRPAAVSTSNSLVLVFIILLLINFTNSTFCYIILDLKFMDK